MAFTHFAARPETSREADETRVEALGRLFADGARVFVLTGAGVSCASGIPVYRGPDGRWLRPPPMTHQDFVSKSSARQRYWARSMRGWPAIAAAAPNAAHRALAALETAGVVQALVTQNVDGLHQRAGSRTVIDLHGRLDAVVCLDCAARHARDDIQRLLEARNPSFEAQVRALAPDGDAHLDAVPEDFDVPDCPRCGGMLKPDVVFHGASVPRARVELALRALADADVLLVVGSSLTTYSGYRFCLEAAAQRKTLVAINRGTTRADALFALKVDADCGEALETCARSRAV